MGPPVLVTGAAGFIGSHLVDALGADGTRVRALVREGEDLANLSDSRPEVVCGDITNPASLRRAMENVEVVYHLAAISRHDVRVPESEYYAANVEGTRNVLEAARESGCRRVVFTGTIEAVGLSGDGAPLTEESPQRPRNIYGETKLKAEDLVRRFGRETGLETVVVRPPMTYGPRERLLLPRLFRVVEKGFYPLVGSGRALTEFCYVGNQVHGLRLAAARGRTGDVYFISDERSYTLEEIVDAIAAELGVRVRKVRLPVPAALALGLAFEGAAKVLPFYPFVIPETGRPPFSRRTVAWTAESRLFVDIGKARRELAYAPPFDLRRGLAETVCWYRAHGHLKPARTRGRGERP